MAGVKGKRGAGAGKTRRRGADARSAGALAGHAREIGALALIAGAILLFLALVSYDAMDPSWNTAAPAGTPVRNLAGSVGAFLADLLVQGLGVGAYAAVVLAVLAAWRLLFRKPEGLRWVELLSWGLIVVCVLMLLPLLVPEVQLGGLPRPTGGVIGKSLAGLLSARLNVTGAVVVAGVLLLVTLKIGLDLSYAPAGAFFGRLATRAGGRLGASAVTVGRFGTDGLAAGGRALGRAFAALGQDTRDWWAERAARARQGEAQREAARARREEEARRAAERAAAVGTPGVGSAVGAGGTTGAGAGGAGDGRAGPAVGPAPPLGAGRGPGRRGQGRAEATGADGSAVADGPASTPRPVEVAPDLDAELSLDDLPVPPLGTDGDAAGVGSGRASAGEGPASAAGASEGGRPRIVVSRHMEDDGPEGADAEQLRLPLTRTGAAFELPSVALLDAPVRSRLALDPDQLAAKAELLRQKLLDYGVEGRVVEIHPGPVVTMFEFEPAPGIKVSKIANLSDDLSMALKATRVRIVAPLPGKGVVGIEVPNDHRETVVFREILAHEEFHSRGFQLPIALGKDIVGKPTAADWAKMPHLLIAGTTGSGKSVSVNSIILSILLSRTPDEVRMILVDPKMLEFSLYDGIPHLLLPVVTSPKKAAMALKWGVEEMTRRYKLLAQLETRNIVGYNQRVDQIDKRVEEVGEAEALRGLPLEERPTRLPYIVIVIDELADLMMVAAKDVQDSIVRLAQMARAAGIHLLLATQRPSVDVITGLIKANFPARVSFRVSSKIDSRTILDCNGAEHLLGSGDMLFLLPGKGELKRIHGAFVSDDEVKRVVAHLKQQAVPQYLETILEPKEGDEEPEEEEEKDEVYDQAVRIVAETRAASTSMIQRRLKIGYNRAARIIERMEREGVVGPADGVKPREVYVQPQVYDFE